MCSHLFPMWLLLVLYKNPGGDTKKPLVPQRKDARGAHLHGGRGSRTEKSNCVEGARTHGSRSPRAVVRPSCRGAPSAADRTAAPNLGFPVGGIRQYCFVFGFLHIVLPLQSGWFCFVFCFCPQNKEKRLVSGGILLFYLDN